MSEYIHKSHNVTVLIYHLVFPAKYRRAVIDIQVEEVLKNVCLKIEKRYQLKFLEIGADTDGYFASTVGRHGNENMIADYVKKQGKKYQKLYEDRQLVLF
jgi:REP element-mobilizing transposase RayT